MESLPKQTIMQLIDSPEARRCRDAIYDEYDYTATLEMDKQTLSEDDIIDMTNQLYIQDEYDNKVGSFFESDLDCIVEKELYEDLINTLTEMHKVVDEDLTLDELFKYYSLI